MERSNRRIGLLSALPIGAVLAMDDIESKLISARNQRAFGFKVPMVSRAPCASL